MNRIEGTIVLVNVPKALAAIKSMLQQMKLAVVYQEQ